MKRNKFMEFLNSKGQYAAIFAFVVVAGICAGTAAYNKNKPQVKTDEISEQPSASSEPVLTNKNAETKAEPSGSKPSNADTNVNTENNTTVPETEKTITDSEDEDIDITFLWPVDGDILLGYSPESAIYDVTLDQYRTNDNVCISAEVGDEVKASADGVVSEIVRDDLLGNYVVIDHENGWKTTYSQLAEINCSVGEAVSAGEIIGSVSEPSIYSEAMGPHVEFMVTLDDVSVNPEVAVG